jgi:RNA polymerase sigma-70 factor (ECF subfamily)
MTTFSPSPSDAGDQPVCDWGALLAAHEGWLRTAILARTGELQAVDEVYQRVALAAVAQAAPLADRARAAPWLHRLAVIQSARYRRTLGRERRALQTVRERSPHLGNGYADDALAWLLARERQTQTQTALARLNGADAEILLLKYGERWSCRQIAERLGITEKAVDARLVRARGRLRAELVQLGIGGDER